MEDVREGVWEEDPWTERYLMDRFVDCVGRNGSPRENH